MKKISAEFRISPSFSFNSWHWLNSAMHCWASLKIQGNFSSSKEDGLSISAASMMRGNAAPSHSMPHHKPPLDTAKLHRKRVSITAASVIRKMQLSSHSNATHHMPQLSLKDVSLTDSCTYLQPIEDTAILPKEDGVSISTATSMTQKNAALLPFHATDHMPPLPLKDVALTDSTTTSLQPI